MTIYIYFFLGGGRKGVELLPWNLLSSPGTSFASLGTGHGKGTYGIKCVGRIVTKSMSNFLHLCDCSVPSCASLEAWNWLGAGQHLHASHPRSAVWPIPKVTLFLGN